MNYEYLGHELRAGGFRQVSNSGDSFWGEWNILMVCLWGLCYYLFGDNFIIEGELQ